MSKKIGVSLTVLLSIFMAICAIGLWAWGAQTRQLQVSAAAAEGDELVHNGDFESEDIPKNWANFGADPYAAQPPAIDSETKYEGNGSGEFPGLRARYRMGNGASDTNVSWWESGRFYDFSLMFHSGAVSNSVAIGYVLSATSGNGTWINEENETTFMSWTDLGGGTWKNVSFQFAFENVQNKYYAVKYANGELKRVELTKLQDLPTFGQPYFMIGTSAQDWRIDNFSIKAGSVKKDATIALTDSAGAPVDDATITMKDEDGNALLAQPTVTYDADSQKYVVKDLTYSNSSIKYLASVSINGKTLPDCVITLDSSDVNVTADPFDVTIKVVDEKGAAIADADVTARAGSKEEKTQSDTNGNCAFSDLYNALDIIEVRKDGKVMGFVENVDRDNNDHTIVLKDIIAAKAIEQNIFPNGTCEDPPAGWAYEPVLTEKYPHSGSHSYLITATNKAEIRLSSGTYSYNFKYDGTPYYFEYYVKSTDGAIVELAMETSAPALTGSAWAYPTGKVQTAITSDAYVKVSGMISIRYDAEEEKTFVRVNDEQEVATPCMAPVDQDLSFSLTGADQAFIDDIVLLETYTATATVKDASGNGIEGATFKAVDFQGQTIDLPSIYRDGVYTFANCKGVMKVIATVNGKTYDETEISKDNKNITIADPYTVTVTLKDQNGNLVEGATVILRKGITKISDFTETEKGVYVSGQIMEPTGLVVVVTKDGYTFSNTSGVSASNNTLTIEGVNNQTEIPPQNVEPSDKGCGGCKSALQGGFGGVSILAIVLIGIAIFLLKKKKHSS